MKLITQILLLIAIPWAFGQDTLTLVKSTGLCGEDAMIRYYNGEGDPQNFDNYSVNMHAWTNQGILVIHRSLLKFNIEEFNTASQVISAQLNLKTDITQQYYPGHNTSSGSNEANILRTTSNWSAQNVTWNTQPNTTPVNQVFIPQSSSTDQNYTIDVTDLLIDAINSGDNYFGLMIKLSNESYYRRMNFASSENVNTSLHPTLEITCLSTIDTLSCSIPTESVEGTISIPNVITVNGDNINDFFTLTTSNSELVEILILNRWGNTVYASDNYLNNWPTSDDVENLSEGVYFYKITYDNNRYHGFLHLVK